MYYLRSRPAADPIKFTLDVEAIVKDENTTNLEANMFNKVKRKTKKVKRKVKVKRRKKTFN